MTTAVSYISTDHFVLVVSDAGLSTAFCICSLQPCTHTHSLSGVESLDRNGAHLTRFRGKAIIDKMYCCQPRSSRRSQANSTVEPNRIWLFGLAPSSQVFLVLWWRFSSCMGQTKECTRHLWRARPYRWMQDPRNPATDVFFKTNLKTKDRLSIGPLIPSWLVQAEYSRPIAQLEWCTQYSHPCPFTFRDSLHGFEHVHAGSKLRFLLLHKCNRSTRLAARHYVRMKAYWMWSTTLT